MSRKLGARLARHKGKRVFLDELPADAEGRALKNMDFDSTSIDEVMEYAQYNQDEMKFIAVKLCIDQKVKEVDDHFINLMNEEDFDQQYADLHQFASKLLKG